MPAKLNFFRRLQEGQRIDHTSAIVLARVRTQTAGQKIRRHQLSLQLPNISGQIQGNSDTWKMGGVFSYSSWTRGPGISSTGTTSISGSVLLDGMKSNSIFGQSETVQPPSIRFMPAIKF